MAYVAVSGGEEAIEAGLELLRQRRYAPESALEIATVVAALPEAVDQVMSESSLYDRDLAALALKQASGSLEEAVFILRAFRSTLERPYTSRTIETADMCVERRISAAFKDIPGGQVLGLTRDYSHRLLDFEQDTREAQTQAGPLKDKSGFQPMPKVSEYLVSQGLMEEPACDDSLPGDLTMEALSFPAPRSIRLQALTRGMSQAVMALGYAAIRGFGPTHPTVGELRYGSLDILIDHPFKAGSEDDAYYVGAIEVTEVESLFSIESTSASGVANGDLPLDPVSDPGADDHELEFGIGYGLVYGSLESKAIAMSVLDFCLMNEDTRYPTQDEEFVLYHIDGIEATGFISHLKLPHYVTFQSKLNSTRQTRRSVGVEEVKDASTL